MNMKMFQMIQWKYSGDPRAIQYKECLADYHLLSDSRRDKKELKKILLLLAKLYKDNMRNKTTLMLISNDIAEYYQYLSDSERQEYQKLIEKMEVIE